VPWLAGTEMGQARQIRPAVQVRPGGGEEVGQSGAAGVEHGDLGRDRVRACTCRETESQGYWNLGEKTQRSG
jgi:hypothetical protein